MAAGKLTAKRPSKARSRRGAIGERRCNGAMGKTEEGSAAEQVGADQSIIPDRRWVVPRCDQWLAFGDRELRMDEKLQAQATPYRH